MFDGLLNDLSGYGEITGTLQNKGNVFASGLSGSNKAHVLYSLLQDLGQKSCLVITPNEESAAHLFRDLSFFCDDRVFLFPEREYIFYDLDTASNEVQAQRLSVLERLCRGDGIVIATAASAAKPVLPKSMFLEYTVEIAEGDMVDFDVLTDKLTLAGYSRAETVEGRGQFAVRGGLMDIYPLTADQPYRIELFGDEVDTIRSFDPFSQLSIDRISRITVPPAHEIIYTREKAEEVCKHLEKYRSECDGVAQDIEKFRNRHYFASNDKYLPLLYPETPQLSDYFSADALVVFDEPRQVREKIENTIWEISQSVTQMMDRGALAGVTGEYCAEYAGLISRNKKRTVLSLCALVQSGTGISYAKIVNLEAKSQSTYNGNTALLVEDLKLYQRQGYRVIMLAGGRSRGTILRDELDKEGITARFTEDSGEQPEGFLITTGSLSGGFEYPQLKLAVISDRDIFKKKRMKKAGRPPKDQKALRSAEDLNVGDYVVHVNHGIGQYVGQELVKAGGITKDYFKIKYGGTDFLYVPATQLDMLHKYVGSKTELKLNKLGGKEWQNTKKRVRASCADIADGLIKLYAARQNVKGYQFSPDTPWQAEFEDTFPYVETADQIKCINEVKADMERDIPMDRLLCGDVGYGKTEVAIRAAFKCVMDGKQVAYLAPTTILASQHYQNFKKRMENFAIKVEMMSRFKSPKEQKEIVKETAAGAVDIVIGTHRLLQKDLKFKSLGLLIVDEEQRFGVAHKERLKEIKQDVDVLTMTATPIPRTLHMSMIGIRDISVIGTPPQDRYPVRTYVMEQNLSIVADAVIRELSRGGQVYYLYNRVEGIARIAKRISEMVPSARVEFAHGQMPEHELERIMIEVQNGGIDVLVCTTIIETGLDIPNVNTIIIEDADRLGLAQLYQLRGRVGRSDRMAYAYLMYKRDKVLSEVAQKRLIALRDFTEFGSGFKIAMRDLEIRGAGNVLGAEQHGHMDSVGYELFCTMLEEEVKKRQGIVSAKAEVQIDLLIDAYIPKSYIHGEETRIDIYRRIAEIETQQDYSDMCDELCDRFGDMDACVVNLLEVALLKNTAGAVGIHEIRQAGDNLNFFFVHATPELMALAGTVVAENKGRLLLSAGEKPCLTFRKGAAGDADTILSNIKIILQRFFELKFPEK